MRKDAVCQLGLLVGALGYFCADLSTHQLSMLESQDLGIASELLTKFALSPDHSALHFLFLDWWQGLNGTSAAFLRVPSACFCALAATSVYRLARREGGVRAGLAAAVLFALNPLVVDNARSLRMYSLSLLLIALCLEAAHAHLVRPRMAWALPAFTLTGVAAIYNHLFLWLPVGCVALLVGADGYRERHEPDAWRRLLRHAALGVALLVPQAIHGVVALRFTSDRHALFPGLSQHFLLAVGRALVFGERANELRLSNLWLCLPLGLLGLAIHRAGRRGAIAGATILLPLLLGWFLSRSSEVESRYFNFLLPGLSALTALCAGLVTSTDALGVAGGLVVLGLSLSATRLGYRDADRGWAEGGERLRHLLKPGEPVAVFPGYWARTLRCYASFDDVIPVTFPGDLARLLARGRRVFLVRNGGRVFDSMAALLAERTQARSRFSTTGDDPFEVLELIDEAERPALPPLSASALTFGGVVGSGGYAWPGGRAARSPFGRLRDYFATSRAVVVGFESYRPAWLARLALGSDAVDALEQTGPVLRALADAGVTAITPIGEVTAPEPRAGLAQIPSAPPGLLLSAVAGPSPSVPVRVLSLSEEVARRAQAELSHGARSGTLERTLSSVRKGAEGPSALVAVVVPAAPDYGRLATREERALAHALVDGGADLVVGEGGYATKEIEERAGAVIAYSLGTLLRPSSLTLASRDSSAVLLRISPDKRRGFAYQVTPVTFDDRSRPSFGRSEEVTELVRHEHAAPNLADFLERGAEPSAGAARCERGTWDATFTLSGSPAIRAAEHAVLPLTQWFPSAPVDSALEPASGGCVLGNSFVLLRGVTSLGAYRRAVEIEPGSEGQQALTLPRVTLGQRLELGYGLADDRLRSRFRTPRSRQVRVEVGGNALLETELPYAVGWHDVSLDTASLAGQVAALRFVVEGQGSGFPVALTASIK